MSAPQMILCCSNGHVQPMPNSKFCIYCGEPTQLQSLGPVASPNSGAYTPPAMAPAAAVPVQPMVMTPTMAVPVHGPRIAAKSSHPGYCSTCGGDGSGLAANRVVCPECRWLRPLVPGYQVDASAFAWAGDAKAMATLRSIKVLTAAAAAVSEKVGRRWIEGHCFSDAVGSLHATANAFSHGNSSEFSSTLTYQVSGLRFGFDQSQT